MKNTTTTNVNIRLYMPGIRPLSTLTPSLAVTKRSIARLRTAGDKKQTLNIKKSVDFTYNIRHPIDCRLDRYYMLHFRRTKES